MSDVTRRTRRKRKWHAWCGEIEDLRRLAQLVEELAELRRTALLDQKVVEDYELERWGRAKNDRLTYVTVIDGPDEATAVPETALGEIDRRSVSGIRLFADFPGFSEKLEVDIASGPLTEGVQLEVESRDPGWARQAFTQLSDEIDKAIPAWARFRSNKIRLMAGFAAAAAITVVALLVLNAVTPLRDVEIIIGLTFIIMWPLGLVFVTSDTLVDWLFPNFEVYGEGGSPSGTRRLATLLALAASIPLGIIVNVIS